MLLYIQHTMTNKTTINAKLLEVIKISNKSLQSQCCDINTNITRKREPKHILFCSTGVSGGDSSLTKLLLSSVISVPEYTPLSSQMDRILSADFITFWSPSNLEKGEGKPKVSWEIYVSYCWCYMLRNFWINKTKAMTEGTGWETKAKIEERGSQKTFSLHLIYLSK